MAQDALDALLAEWQKRLRLQDWRITVVLVDSDLMPDYSGRAHVFSRKRKAVIKINAQPNSPHDTIDRYDPFDYEETLVHELLELHFNPFKAEDLKDGYEEQEQAINMIAYALVQLKREGAVMPVVSIPTVFSSPLVDGNGMRDLQVATVT